jgi:hypothetical protein
MRTVFTLVFIAAAMQAGFAQAIQMASPQSNKIVKTCLIQGEEVAEATCRAFIIGVADTTMFYSTAQQMTPQFCIPHNTDAGDLVAVYRDYLRSNHSLKQFSAAALAVSAFKNAYPCK